MELGIDSTGYSAICIFRPLSPWTLCLINSQALLDIPQRLLFLEERRGVFGSLTAECSSVVNSYCCLQSCCFPWCYKPLFLQGLLATAFSRLPRRRGATLLCLAVPWLLKLLRPFCSISLLLLAIFDCKIFSGLLHKSVKVGQYSENKKNCLSAGRSGEFTSCTTASGGRLASSSTPCLSLQCIFICFPDALLYCSFLADTKDRFYAFWYRDPSRPSCSFVQARQIQVVQQCFA